MNPVDRLSIGELAHRTGLAVSAIRYYEAQGLLQAARNQGGHRRFLRSDIRRVSFVVVAQKFGFSLAEIREELDALPTLSIPTAQDWSAMASRLRDRLNARIQTLQALRDRLDGCIGCGCLSLESCALRNPGDVAKEHGAGPRYLLGDSPAKDL